MSRVPRQAEWDLYMWFLGQGALLYMPIIVPLSMEAVLQHL